MKNLFKVLAAFFGFNSADEEQESKEKPKRRVYHTPKNNQSRTHKIRVEKSTKPDIHKTNPTKSVKKVAPSMSTPKVKASEKTAISSSPLGTPAKKRKSSTEKTTTSVRTKK